MEVHGQKVNMNKFVSFACSSYFSSEPGRKKSWKNCLMIILIKQWFGSMALGQKSPQRIPESGLICNEERKYSDFL